MNANVHIKGAHRYTPLLILAGLVLAACIRAQPAFQPAATIVLAPNVPSTVSSEHLDAARRVVVQLTPSGTEKLARFTTSNVGRYLVISSDRQVITAPRIQAAIAEGQAVIAGAFTELDAKSLAAVVNSGALPVPLKIVSIH